MQYNFDVLRIIQDDSGTRAVTDYVSGIPLAEYISEHPDVRKEELFTWFQQIVSQTNQYLKSQSVAFRVTPFHLIRTPQNEIRILDQNASVNQKYLTQIKTNSLLKKFSTDTNQSMRQTIQFLLAKTTLTPKLTRREEAILQKFLITGKLQPKGHRGKGICMVWIIAVVILLLTPRNVAAPEPETFFIPDTTIVTEVREICKDQMLSKTEKEEKLKELLKQHPEILREIQFQKLQQEHGFHMEGGEVCFER